VFRLWADPLGQRSQPVELSRRMATPDSQFVVQSDSRPSLMVSSVAVDIRPFGPELQSAPAADQAHRLQLRITDPIPSDALRQRCRIVPHRPPVDRVHQVLEVNNFGTLRNPRSGRNRIVTLPIFSGGPPSEHQHRCPNKAYEDDLPDSIHDHLATPLHIQADLWTRISAITESALASSEALRAASSSKLSC
jgi:hypothetical protein